MRFKKKVIRKSTVEKAGQGLLNTLINKIPFELHIPGYKFCGPGTKLEKRILKGDTGINPLDEACKIHDIAYSQTKDLAERHKADKILEKSASKRLTSSDSPIGEKMAALGIKGAMKIKRKLGMGLKKKIRKRGGALMKHPKKKKTPRKERLIPSPKKGGFLPLLLPLLGALGAVGGGAASIAKAVNDAKAKNKQLEEQKRHDLAMEEVSRGKGLYLRPYKGYGLYLKPYQKNSR